MIRAWVLLLPLLIFVGIGCAGDDGADGAEGPAGADGTNGSDGTPGVDGSDGAAGTNGTNGADGANGVDGVNAVDTGTDEVVEFAAIQGTVVDAAGDPVEGAVVTVEGQTATSTTAADGTFDLQEVVAGPVYINAASPSEVYLNGGLRHSVFAANGADTTGVEIVLPGRPSATATWVGGGSCNSCHAGIHKDIVDGVAASIHGRFVTEGTDHLVYTELWPAPGEKFMPRDPSGVLLMAQDPSDGEGLVNVVMCTRDVETVREYVFKFYPQQFDEISLTEAELDCTDSPADAVWVPVGGTIGGEGNWGEGYLDPDHNEADKHPNFGEGKQRYLARIQDVPYLVDWMTDNGIPVDRAKQDYVSYLPVYLVQDATPADSDLLSGNDVGGPKFWQKAPDHWCVPTNTISRNCAGCHTTGLKIEYENVTELDGDGAEVVHKAVVTSYDYIDLNVTCERCHGPGSEHAVSGDVTKVINPKLLTAESSNETCGQCHASHAGKSQNPPGIFKYAFDETNIDTLGNGVFVPGVYSLTDFYANYNMPTANNSWSEGTFHTWPDGTHGRAHSQQLPEMLRSAHSNNPWEKLTCASCHDTHSLSGSPATMTVGSYEFGKTSYADNTLCLACHASHGSFENITLDDVAVLQFDAERGVEVDGAEPVFSDMDIAQSHGRVANSVALHMQHSAGMGGALYTPKDEESPVGRCTTCHMAKIGKLFDVNDDAQYHLALDANGNSAVAEGNMPSHGFDIVWPGQSSVLLSDDLATGHDYDIMPNSCGNCHDFARLSGDLD